MPLPDLQDKLYDLEGFQRHLLNLTLYSVINQFPKLQPAKEMVLFQIDWKYLLLCASILARSEYAKYQDAALRIAQHCLQNAATPPNARAAAAVILDSLTNRPAIQLAINRGYVANDFFEQIPTPLKLDWFRRSFTFTILDKTHDLLPINKFQKDLLKSADQNDWLSISAPTSSGKSFILTRWIQKYLAYHPGSTIVYLVPTRALIQQVQIDIAKVLAENNLKDVYVASIPTYDTQISSGRVYVFTQERLHLFLNVAPASLMIDVLIIDEAQKLGDGSRGILLQQVIETVLERSPKAKVFFLSPSTSNPESLLSDAPSTDKIESIKSTLVTVNQNLIWASQLRGRPKQWKIELCLEDREVQLGTIELPFTPAPPTKRLPFVAYTLVDNETANLIYVNGAADAEKTARQLWDLCGNDEESQLDGELTALIDLVKKTIHKDYALAEVLSRGVAFHYGNMPLLIRNEIEKLFKIGKIRFLVCTSTLIEGVNLPAKSIFVRGPKKGKGTPMNAADFWNLAGRAGRWGIEFQGNIICVDPRDAGVWKIPPPRQKTMYVMTRTADQVISQPNDLLAFIKDDTPRSMANKRPELEYIVGYLINHFLKNNSLIDSDLSKKYSATALQQFEGPVSELVSKMRIPLIILKRNPGISPIAMNSLWDYFEGYKKPLDELLPVPPESEDAVERYVRIIARINSHLSGDSHGRDFFYALLVVNWMRGYPLSRIIASRVKHLTGKGKNFRLASVIRETMADIEEYARFKFLKFVSCYIDLLIHFLQQRGKEKLIDMIPHLNLWLEFGASQRTQVSLMSLGLSRISAIGISELIADDSLNEKQCLQWLRTQNLKSLDLSSIIIEEIERILEARME